MLCVAQIISTVCDRLLYRKVQKYNLFSTETREACTASSASPGSSSPNSPNLGCSRGGAACTHDLGVGLTTPTSPTSTSADFCFSVSLFRDVRTETKLF